MNIVVLSIHLEFSKTIIQFQVLHSNKGQDHGVNLDVCFGKEDPTTFLNDGIRKIDFVLVVEENAKDFAESDGFTDGFNANTDDSSK